MIMNLTKEDYIIIGKMWEKKSSLNEPRVVLALKLGRPLEKTEIAHHLNGNHDDNRPDNLRLCSSASEHRSYHLKYSQYRGRIEDCVELFIYKVWGKQNESY